MKSHLTGYIILVRDTSWFMNKEWAITKGSKSVPISTDITYDHCYRTIAHAKTIITRLTRGRTDCVNCMYAVVPVKFTPEISTINIRDIVKKGNYEYV